MRQTYSWGGAFDVFGGFSVIAIVVSFVLVIFAAALLAWMFAGKRKNDE